MSQDPLSAFDASNGVPVTIVFGTFNFRETIALWIEMALGGSCDHWRIVCMDEELVQWMHEYGHGAQAVYYYDVLPGAPRHNFGELLRNPLMNALMPLRTRLFLHLAKAGRDFINSDADAFWVRDPRPWLARHTQFDLLVSQGTGFPASQYRLHQFVLCAGFFLCRSNDRTRIYFERVESLLDEDPTDQYRMNAVLMRDPAGSWDIRKRGMRFRRGKNRGWKEPSFALRTCLTLLRLLPAFAKRGMMSLVPLRTFCFIRISSEVMRGRFSDDLTVGVIPMHLVCRSAVTPSCEYVWHQPATPHGWKMACQQRDRQCAPTG